MKKHFQTNTRLVALLIALFLGMGTAYSYDFSAECSTGQTLYYNIIDAANHYVELTYPGNSVSNSWNGYTKPTGNITLPSSVSYNDVTYTVTRIGNYAFNDCSGMTGSLVIPNSVTRIGDYAFENCSGFTGTLTIGNAVTTIRYGAFKDCSRFEQVKFNAINCSDLVHPNFDYFPFQFCGGSLAIGNSVQRIPTYIFSYANFTGSLTIPNSVTAIGEFAFEGCDDFRGSLTIGSAVTTIGDYAFFDPSWTSITVRADTPPSLGDYVFFGVNDAIPVYVPCASMDDYQDAEGWSEFTNITCLRTVTVAAVPTAGGTVTGGGSYDHGETCTVTATPNTGYQFMNWSKDGTVVSCNASYSFTVTEDVALEAVFLNMSGAGTVVGTGATVSANLPSNSSYLYSLTQQIYTADELGGSQTITSISFFNTGAEKTRNYDIYLKHTVRNEFDETTLMPIHNGGANSQYWISVGETDKVYSGNVTMRQGMWTTIVLDTPFTYNGNSNLVLTVDDNTGAFSSDAIECRTYVTGLNQTMFGYNNDTNYDPFDTDYCSGSFLTEKNQIMLNRPGFNIAAVSANTTAGTVSGGGTYGLNDLCRLKATANSGYTFLSWTDDSGVVVSTEADYSFLVDRSMSLTACFLAGSDVCSLTFDLFDSWGDGWNGNYLTVDYGNSLVQRLAVPGGGSHANFTLPAVNGSHIDLGWELGSYAYECSFIVSYGEDDVIYMNSSLNGSFEYGIDVDCDGHVSWPYIGDHSGAASFFLPTTSDYCYSMTQQIYTADEIGAAGTLKGIAFHNDGGRSSRSLHIYLKATEKTVFSGASDWVSVTDDDLVFVGSVTMQAGAWVPITFNTPFEYDGVSNLVLVVDDATGTWDDPQNSILCRVFNASGNQTLRILSNDNNFTPTNPSGYSGTLTNTKNQLLLDIERATVTQTIPLAAGANWFSPFVETTLVDLQTALTDALGTTSVQISISSQTEYSELKRGNWVGTMTSLDVSRMYIISVSSDCEIALEGLPVNPADHVVTISNGANWIAYPLSDPMSIATVFSGFAENGDGVSSQTEYSKYTRGNWVGGVNQLEPGKGYIYKSTASGDKEFVFPTVVE